MLKTKNKKADGWRKATRMKGEEKGDTRLVFPWRGSGRVGSPGEEPAAGGGGVTSTR